MLPNKASSTAVGSGGEAGSTRGGTGLEDLRLNVPSQGGTAGQARLAHDARLNQRIGRRKVARDMLPTRLRLRRPGSRRVDGLSARRFLGAPGANRHLATSQPVLAGAPLPRPLRQVCVLVPTRDESGNVAALLSRLGPVLTVVNGEVLFVDDSDDDTPSVIAAAGQAAGGPVRMLHRAPGERLGGLGGAVQAGLATVTAPWTVVMDADLQHPPERIPDLLAAAWGGADLVVASRYSGDGTAEGLSSGVRRVGSSGKPGCPGCCFRESWRRSPTR
jgi:glycosyl transferase family 2